jgi:hypothetical protein
MVHTHYSSATHKTAHAYAHAYSHISINIYPYTHIHTFSLEHISSPTKLHSTTLHSTPLHCTSHTHPLYALAASKCGGSHAGVYHTPPHSALHIHTHIYTHPLCANTLHFTHSPTICPCSFKMAAVTLESTPPLMATSTRLGTSADMPGCAEEQRRCLGVWCSMMGLHSYNG